MFARAGYMDKSSESIKFALYIIEHTFSDFYKPHLGIYRMDATVRENSIYFNALFRYAQVTAILGCPTVSSAVGILLLSLDPLGDPMHILLALDFYLLASNNHSTLKAVLHGEHLLLGYPLAQKSIPPEKPPELPTLMDLPNWEFSEVSEPSAHQSLRVMYVLGTIVVSARRQCWGGQCFDRGTAALAIHDPPDTKAN